jgi:hypothetical protein
MILMLVLSFWSSSMSSASVLSTDTGDGAGARGSIRTGVSLSLAKASSTNDFIIPNPFLRNNAI